MSTNRNVIAYGQENHDKICKTKLAIIGDNGTAQATAIAAAGLGCEHIHFISNQARNKHTTLLDIIHQESTLNWSADIMQNVLKALNPHITSQTLRSAPVKPIIDLVQPNIIINTNPTGDHYQQIATYAAKKRIPVIHSYTENNTVHLFVQHKNNTPSANKPTTNNENLLCSMIAAGMAIEQFRKLLFAMPHFQTVDTPLQQDQHIAFNPSSTSYIPYSNQARKCLVAGAGGIGTFAAIAAASLGYGQVDILDNDTIQNTNINRQFVYYQNIGAPKAHVLAQKLQTVFEHSKCKAVQKRLGEINFNDSPWLEELMQQDNALFKSQKKDYAIQHNLQEFTQAHFNPNTPLLTKKEFNDAQYDVVFGCLDNKYARLWLDNMCHTTNTLYVDGGTMPTLGRSITNAGGNKIQDQYPLMQDPPLSHSCADQPMGSVCMSNMVIGSSMVAYATHLLHRPSAQPLHLHYDTTDPHMMYWKKP